MQPRVVRVVRWERIVLSMACMPGGTSGGKARIGSSGMTMTTSNGGKQGFPGRAPSGDLGTTVSAVEMQFERCPASAVTRSSSDGQEGVE